MTSTANIRIKNVANWILHEWVRTDINIDKEKHVSCMRASSNLVFSSYILLKWAAIEIHMRKFHGFTPIMFYGRTDGERSFINGPVFIL